MASLLREILDHGGINVYYQPIFEMVDGRPVLFAVEALSRGPKGSNAERPDVLFEYVRRKAKEVEVDRACVKAIFSKLYIVARRALVSINVHALTLERDDLFTPYLTEMCRLFHVPASNIILEIVEQQRYRNPVRFFTNLELLRGAGFRIAVDDIGLGHSNYRALVEIRPDLYKIDRYFVSGCNAEPHKQAAIESIVLLAGRLGGRVIAEGVETADDLACVTALGITLVQGFHFAMPQPVHRLQEPTPRNVQENCE
jgi:EAL domain-containing protein (putative c-di-GMP-specific phosphodiesterase class I)